MIKYNELIMMITRQHNSEAEEKLVRYIVFVFASMEQLNNYATKARFLILDY